MKKIIINFCNARRFLVRAHQLIICLLVLGATNSHAHRGPIDQIDNCRIAVGFEKIHFTAYTPEISQGQEYCQFIPHLGLTSLVFDYEGKKLRNVSIEYEITQEPEGKRVFYQEPQKIKNGTMNALIDFTPYGLGNYLAHITIVHKGEKLDKHLAFVIGEEALQIPWNLLITLLIVLSTAVYLFYLNKKHKKNLQP